MNAYDLADKLETDKWDEATIVRSIDAGIKMLRQQADRITELEMTSNTAEIADLLQHQADYIDFLEQALESSINLNKAQAERKT